jgi:hypothetical protein
MIAKASFATFFWCLVIVGFGESLALASASSLVMQCQLKAPKNSVMKSLEGRSILQLDAVGDAHLVVDDETGKRSVCRLQVQDLRDASREKIPALRFRASRDSKCSPAISEKLQEEIVRSVEFSYSVITEKAEVVFLMRDESWGCQLKLWKPEAFKRLAEGRIQRRN